MSEPLPPLSSAPSPSLRERVWQAKGKILLGVVLLAIICIKAYWNSDIHPYLKDHPFVWQRGLIILGAVALFAGIIIYRRNRSSAPLILPSEDRLPATQENLLPDPHIAPQRVEGGERIFINGEGQRIRLIHGWRRRFDENQQPYFHNLLTQISQVAPPSSSMEVMAQRPISAPLPPHWIRVAYPSNPRAFYHSNTVTNDYNWIAPFPMRNLTNHQRQLLELFDSEELEL